MTYGPGAGEPGSPEWNALLPKVSDERVEEAEARAAKWKARCEAELRRIHSLERENAAAREVVEAARNLRGWSELAELRKAIGKWDEVT